MPRTAIISDIHANMQALEAVLLDARTLGVERFICLGDIVGYGAQPLDCIEIIREISSATIRGNHEEAVIHGPFGFNPLASAAVHWTREQLDSERGRSTDSLPFIESLAERIDLEDATLVHGSPTHPMDEYLFREDTLDYLPRRQDFSPKLAHCFKLIDRPCFVGHTHVPGVIDSELRWNEPRANEGEFDTQKKPCFVNVGSVGQPRDGDHRASYAIFDGQTVSFRRVTYDVKAAAARIFKEDQLPDLLGQRLLEAW
jgi:diadenosine tetraphosphatase ApaH/serine/threonine PP2A family protein phosphatase